MASKEQQPPQVISVDCRKVRDIGNSVAQSLDLEALRSLGLVDKDGELVDDDMTARQEIRDDGTVLIDLPEADD